MIRAISTEISYKQAMKATITTMQKIPLHYHSHVSADASGENSCKNCSSHKRCLSMLTEILPAPSVGNMIDLHLLGIDGNYY